MIWCNIQYVGIDIWVDICSYIPRSNRSQLKPSTSTSAPLQRRQWHRTDLPVLLPALAKNSGRTAKKVGWFTSNKMGNGEDIFGKLHQLHYLWWENDHVTRDILVVMGIDGAINLILMICVGKGRFDPIKMVVFPKLSDSNGTFGLQRYRAILESFLFKRLKAAA